MKKSVKNFCAEIPHDLSSFRNELRGENPRGTATLLTIIVAV